MGGGGKKTENQNLRLLKRAVAAEHFVIPVVSFSSLANSPMGGCLDHLDF